MRPVEKVLFETEVELLERFGQPLIFGGSDGGPSFSGLSIRAKVVLIRYEFFHTLPMKLTMIWHNFLFGM